MHLLEPDRPEGLATLIRVFIVLGLLLIVLAVLTLLNDTLGLLDRFRSELYLFVIGALLAYLMAPAVRILQRVLRAAWAAVLGAYLLLFAAVLVFGALLVTPFVTQAQSLVKHMQNPSASSLVRLQDIRGEIGGVQAELGAQGQLLGAGRPIPQAQVRQTQAEIARLVRQVEGFSNDALPQNVAPIPLSYVIPVAAPLKRLRAAYGQVATATAVDSNGLVPSQAAADQAASQANSGYQKATSTPLLLLSLQTVLDQHNISVDLHDRFSQALQTVNNQVTALLNNALGIGVQAGNLLIDVVLIFIISIYLVRDGGRFIGWLVQRVPAGSRSQASRAVVSLDQILGSYLRTQIVLALLAGISDAVGAVILGIPYATVIFFSSFLLSLVPVIGPVILPIPPLGIALIFVPLPKPLLYLAWLLIGEQIVTNVVGPRLQARNLRIHPLEAMAAALIGLPLAGIPGAFFAVPLVAFFHIAIREFAHARQTEVPAPTGTLAGSRPPPDTAEHPVGRGSRPGT